MGHISIVLMDELDQLVTTKQDVVYNFFNWPNLVGSKLIVLAVANTHDLPERTLSAKVRSRLGMTLSFSVANMLKPHHRDGSHQFCALHKGSAGRDCQLETQTC
jgi:hypothetical protein